MKMLFTYNPDLLVVSASGLVLIPIIVALVQAIKLTGWVSARFAPLLAIGLGMLISLLADHDTMDYMDAILSGAIYGLSASGLYSGVKASTQQQNSKPQPPPSNSTY